MYKNLLLIQPPNDSGKENLSWSDRYPPLGLLSIATYLKQKSGERLNISVADLNIDSSINTAALINNADIVGITANSFNYNYALNIAKMAKEIGSTVVLGGVHARALRYNILKNREFIDYIIDGEGEIPLSLLVEGYRIQNIPNVVFRNNGDIKSNQLKYNNLSALPIIDRSFIKIDNYISKIKDYDPISLKHTSIYTHKGCSWRDVSGGCIFCARKDAPFQTRPVKQIWKEILELHKKYGINYIWNIADDFLADITWVKKLVAEKPESLNIRFLIYTRADNITEETISLMKESIPFLVEIP